MNNAQPIIVNENYKIIAFTDSVIECDCCGKQNLKATYCVVLFGEEKYFGSVCAWKKHGISKNDLSIAKKVASGKKVYFVNTYELDDSSYYFPEATGKATKTLFNNESEAIDFVQSKWNSADGYDNNPISMGGKMVRTQKGAKKTSKAWQNLETKKAYTIGFDIV